MNKQETPKREKLYSRKRWAARRFLIFLLVLLAVNHLLQIGFQPGDTYVTLRYERFGEEIAVEIPLPEVEP